VEPLTESNRRPSPYHPHFPGFTARQAPPAGRWQALIWILPRPAASAPPQAIAPAAEQQPVRVLCPASGSSRPRLACQPSPARGAACRPATSRPAVNRRSDDLSYPARPRPEGRAEQAFPSAREKFEPVPLSSPRRKSPSAAQECCGAERHRGTCSGTESGDPAARARPASTGTPGSAEIRALPMRAFMHSHAQSSIIEPAG
jgi:hypothetical protein